MNQGTPKSLFGAIENGIAEYHAKNEPCHPTNVFVDPDEIKAVRLHVKDFLAQKFQAAKCLAHQGHFHTENDLQLLFDMCVGGEAESARFVFSLKGLQRTSDSVLNKHGGGHDVGE